MSIEKLSTKNDIIILFELFLNYQLKLLTNRTNRLYNIYERSRLMFQIEFYKDKNGYSETAEWLMELDKKAHNSKEHHIRLKKFVEYVEILKQHGTYIGEPVVKHLTGTDLWELRPTRDRVFFAHIINDKFLILNHFVKKSKKTPIKEIEKSKSYVKRLS